MATIYDVAALAGVSAATVSRVFSGGSVGPEKTRLVKEAAAQLNFTPSRTARALRRHHAELIALIVPDIANPYFADIARGVEEVAVETGYSVILCNSDLDPANEKRYLSIALSESVAGVIIAPSSPDTDVDELQRDGRPVVTIDRTLRTAAVDAVVTDDHAAGRSATQALIDAGYSRIACVSGPSTLNTGLHRAEGWRSALRSSGLEADDDLLVHGPFVVDGGRAATEALLDLPEPPDAVVACSNLLAVGVLQALTVRGIHPPSFGVAVIGELPFPTIPEESITSVLLPARDMGAEAAKLLIARLGSADGPKRTIMLDSSLSPASPR